MRHINSTIVRSAVALSLLGFVFVSLTKLSTALSTSPWLSTATPEFAVRQAVVPDSDYPVTVSGRGNIDCDNLSFTKRSGLALVVVPGIYNEDTISDCFVSTSIGQVGDNGYANVGGTEYVAEVTNQNGGLTSYRTFPNSDMYISNSSSAPVGAYIWLNHLQSSVQFSHELNGKIWARFHSTGQKLLTDKAGNWLPVMGDNYATSENGQWLLVDSPGRAVLRINLETGEVLPFANSFEYGNGGAAIRMAITSDGQHALVASKSYNYFTLFDLSTCAPVPNVIAQPVACQSRDLNAFIRTKINDMGGILYARFTTDNLLNLYASYNITTSPIIGRFALAAPGTKLTGMDYLGLGDSFSSGEGAFKYEIGTDEKDINMCHLSTVSYPYIIAQKLQLNSFHSVACSGAKTTNIVSGSGVSKDRSKINRDNQYSTLPNVTNLGDWLPGYQKQINFVSANSPHLITLSAIGNDLGFDDIVTACAKPGTCYPRLEDQLELFNSIDSKLPVLVSMYKKTIQANSDKTARIFAVGYPQVALATGNCGLNVHLNQAELVLASSIISRINQVVKTAAAQAGIYYAGIENALNGFRLCEGTAGIMGMNGLTAGGDIHHILGNESYHPTELGQFLMAQAILGTIKATQNTVAPQPTASIPAINQTAPHIANLPKSNRTLRKRIASDPAHVTITANNARTKLPPFRYGLVPGKPYTTSLDGGTPVTNIADAQGSLVSDIPIAADGTIHTIDIAGTDLTGSPIVITTTITTPAPQIGDIELCKSGIDFDHDKIDDACDPIIGPAPTPVIPPTSQTTVAPTASTTATPPSPISTPAVATATLTTISRPTSPIAQQTMVNDEPITFIDVTNDSEEIEVSDNSGTATANPQAGNAPTKLTVQTNSVAQTKNTGKVLGAQTTQSATASSARQFASASKQSLNFIASAHPLRLLGLLLSILLALLLLGWKNRRDYISQKVYISQTRHRLHI